MQWHKWPYWVRGAITAAALMLLFIAVFFLSAGTSFENYAIMLLYMATLPYELLNNLTGGSFAYILSSQYVFSIVFYLLIGSILGWLYGVLFAMSEERKKLPHA